MPRSLFVRSVLAFVLTALAIGDAAAAPARTLADRRASLVWLLASTHIQLSRRTLDELGPGTPQMLIDIANTPRDAMTVRVRALAGLGYYKSEDAYSFLTSLLNERNLIGNADGLQMRRQAIRSIGRAFGDRGVDELLTFRNDEEPGLRQAIAQAIGDSGSTRVLPDLELWLTTEQDIVVRDAVDKAVNQLRGR